MCFGEHGNIKIKYIAVYIARTVFVRWWQSERRSARLRDAVILFSNHPDSHFATHIFSWIFVAIIFQTFAKHLHNDSVPSGGTLSEEMEKHNIKTAKKYDNVYFFILFFFSFRAGGCEVFLPFVEQHNTFTAELLKVESADLTHTLYYFNFLLLFIHFSFHFTKSTSLEHPRLGILLYFVQLFRLTPPPLTPGR